MTKTEKILVASLLVGVLATLQGCATPASSTAMAIASSDIPTVKNSALIESMTVRNVSGGKDTNPLWTSQVDSNGFKNALSYSLQTAGYASMSATGGKYFVDAELQALSQPMFGLTFDVTSTVRYTVEGDGQRKIYPITAVGTATTSDAFVGVERLRIANEKSIKENIKQFLRELSLTFGK